MSRAHTLPAELESLVNEVTAALRIASVKHADFGSSEVREQCRLIDLADEAKEPRAQQPATYSLYGMLKAFAICAVITNEQLEGFGDRIYRPKHPAQPEIKPLQEIRH
jgi:hypothetical protein